MADGVLSWLNNEFLTTLLEETDKEPVQILDFKIKSTSGPGENNHFGELKRVEVTYIEVNDRNAKTIHLFIKMNKPSGILSNVLKDGEFVEKELEMYQSVLPLMFQIKDIVFAAKYYPSKLANVFIFQDVVEDGYVMADRFNRLDFEHCAMVMNKMAKFHAVSVAAHKQDPALIEHTGRELGLTVIESPFARMACRSLKNVCEEVGSWKGCERFASMLRRQLDTYPQELADCFKRSKNLNVLNHGDLWTTNIMFEHDQLGNVVDAIFVDYQITRYGSPALDLQYFLWSSPQEEVMANRFDELCYIYLQVLNAELESLHYEERLTLHQLQEELSFTKPIVLCVLTFILPFMQIDPKVSVDFAEHYYFGPGDDGYDPLKVLCGMKYFRSYMKPILNLLEIKGILK